MTDDGCDLLCLDLPRAEELRRNRARPEELEVLARQAQAFADATRLELALALKDGGELCVCDLAWIAERSQNLVSHHLRTLKNAGLAASRRDGKMVLYGLTDLGGRLLDELASAPLAVEL